MYCFFLGLLPLQTVRGRQRGKKAKRETQNILKTFLHGKPVREDKSAGYTGMVYCRVSCHTLLSKSPKYTLSHIQTFSKESVYCTNCSAAQHAHSKPVAFSQTGSNATFTEPSFLFPTVTAPGAHQPTHHPGLIPRKWSFLHFKSSLSCFPFFFHADGISHVFSCT